MSVIHAAIVAVVCARVIIDDDADVMLSLLVVGIDFLIYKDCIK